MKKYQSNDLLSLSIVLFTFIIITACGGGGGGGGGTPGASNTATISSGQIEGFGSVIVNGVRFDTDNAQFEVENEASGSQADLQLGMQVIVEGSTNADGVNGTATTVRFEDNLEGPITSVSVSTSGLSKELLIMGQLVRVEEGVTMFDNSDPGFNFATLSDAANAGNVVEVSGHDMADGSIQATFIQKKADTLAEFLLGAGELEIKGNVFNLNTTAQTFQIGTLVIDYSVAVIQDPLSEGLPVEVKSTDDNVADNILTADSVEANLPGLGQNDVAKAEVEGFITQFNAGAETFMINGQMVNYSNATFRGGLEEELANNVKVEAEGPMTGGTLIATKVTFKESLKFEANLAAAPTGDVLTLQGLPEFSIRADSSITRFDGFTDLATLVAGNNLRVRARPSTGGQMVATRIIKRSDQPDDRMIVQGQVTSASNPNVTLLGVVVIDTNQIVADNSTDDSPSDNDFEIEDTPVGQGAFFAALENGDTVKARARIDSQAGPNAPRTWEQIELEVEDNN